MSETLTFRNSDDQLLVGILEASPLLPTAAPHPTGQLAFLVCHGMLCNKTHPVVVQIARLLLERIPCHVFRFDFSTGSGESEGVPRFGFLDKEVDDMCAAADFLHSTRSLRVAGVAGHSKGANNVLLLAGRLSQALREQGQSSTARLDAWHFPLAVAAVAPRCYMDGGVKERFSSEQLALLETRGFFDWAITAPPSKPYITSIRVTKEELSARTSIDMESVARSISPTHCRVLVVHGNADTVIPFSDGQRLSALVADAELLEIDGCDHFFSNDGHRQSAAERVCELFGRHSLSAGLHPKM